jgi:hypothetical protein
VIRVFGEGLAAAGAGRTRGGLIRGVTGDRGVVGRVSTTSGVAMGAHNGVAASSCTCFFFFYLFRNLKVALSLMD